MEPWINKAERLPTEQDADPKGCVVAWHVYQGFMVMGWRNTISNSFVTHWAKPYLKPQ